MISRMVPMNLRRRTGMTALSSTVDIASDRAATPCRKGPALVLHRCLGQINSRIEGAPMAVAHFPTEPTVAGQVARQNRNRRAVRIWLGLVLLALFCLVLVGGATRLTQSGLSITEWKPVHGIIP